jgi:hypothetical protein
MAKRVALWPSFLVVWVPRGVLFPGGLCLVELGVVPVFLLPPGDLCPQLAFLALSGTKLIKFLEATLYSLCSFSSISSLEAQTSFFLYFLAEFSVPFFPH